jgi:hypothetical protein
MYQFEHLQESEEAYKETEHLLYEYGSARMIFHEGEKKRVDNARDYSFLRSIHRVEDFVIRLAKSKEKRYCRVVGDELQARMQFSSMGAEFVKAPPSGFAKMFMLNHHHNQLSPYYELYRLVTARYPLDKIFHYSGLYRHFKKHPGYDVLPKEHLQWCADQINEMLGELKEAANRENFIKVVASAKKRAAKNYQSFMNYFEALFRHHADLLVIRVDLGYAKAQPFFSSHDPIEGIQDNVASNKADPSKKPGVEEGQDKVAAETPNFNQKLQLVMHHRDQLVSHLRKRYGDDLIGYAWKLEHGNYKGFHIHLVVILNGATKAYDIHHANVIGEHWQKVITDKGTYFNCNAQKSKYRFCGVGLLNYHDQDLWQKIDKVASYMTKVDLYAHLYVTKRFVDRIRHQAADWGIDLSGDKTLGTIDLDAFDRTQPEPLDSKTRIFGRTILPKSLREADSSDQTPRRGRPRHEDLVGWKDALGQKKKPPAKRAKAKSASDPALSGTVVPAHPKPPTPVPPVAHGGDSSSAPTSVDPGRDQARQQALEQRRRMPMGLGSRTPRPR